MEINRLQTHESAMKNVLPKCVQSRCDVSLNNFNENEIRLEYLVGTSSGYLLLDGTAIARSARIAALVAF